MLLHLLMAAGIFKIFHRLGLFSRLLVDRDDGLTITTLPLEILTEVLKNLDLSDLLRVRQVCRSLHRATTAKPIWIHHYRRCEGMSPGTLTLEKPIDLYSSEELERAVLVWESTQVGWRTKDGTPSRRRTITMADARSCRQLTWTEYFHDAYLVPGGRWLLVFQAEGEISYYDLDSVDYQTKRILVPDYVNAAPNTMVSFTVDASSSFPRQNFRLAQYVRENRNDLQGPIHRTIKIWEISSVLEGDDVTGLTATCLKTVQVDPALGDRRVLLSLRDRYLAIAVSPATAKRWHYFILIVEWPLVEEGSLDYLRRVLNTHLHAEGEIHLLSDERLMAFIPELCLYDYSSAEYTTSTPEAGEYFDLTPPTQCKSLPYSNRTKISAPVLSQGCVWFLVTMDDVARVVTIPDNSRIPEAKSSPTTFIAKDLIPLPYFFPCRFWTARYSFGRRFGILYADNIDTHACELILLEYDVAKEFTSDYVPVVKSIPCGRIPSPVEQNGDEDQEQIWYDELPHRNVLFDEGSGRAVLPVSNRFEVLDFALVYGYGRTP
ncbi:hypothetical protein D9613_000022 [Agrocybe pediades]|uniref:F-box domain-containing protein n=1 Tax=Agrocybe pediades TaxID=84607 RepID=A0A8H4R0X3_9AGAR|nr:hypothetical protein D9613_000022 [Agrocybe pediades]